MKEKIFNKYNLILAIILIIPVIVISFTLKIAPGDELYNFQTTSKMVNGFTLYKDFSILQTPLFFWIGALLQKIFGNYILVFRLYACILGYIFYFLLYNLMKKFNINKTMLFTGILIFICSSITILWNSANYNTLATIFYILGIIIMLKPPSTKNSIIIGIIAFLTFFTKQNIGVFFVTATLICQILIYKKESIKYLLIEFITGLILTTFTCLIMVFQGTFEQFINYCFLGISDFASNNFSFSTGIIKKLVIILMSIIINILFIRFMLKNKNNNYYILWIYATILIFSCLPIINTYHLLLAHLLVILEGIILFDKLCENYYESKTLGKLNVKSYLIYMCIYLAVFITIIAIAQIFLDGSFTIIKDKNSPYYLSFITNKTLEQLNQVCNYVNEQKEKGNNVIVYSSSACLYTPVLKSNNSDLDLAFYGNTGKDGSKGLIEKIDNTPNAIFLLDTDSFWQLDLEAKLHIIQNFRKDGTVGGYNIFRIY